jgi:aryl-alcohol dehydrogenase-like predicted oxidoreductase
MKTRRLGKTAVEIGEIGMGCWQLGADWGAPLDKDAAFAILSAASESGITFFDTADVYGAGRSEEHIGQFIKECGKSITVATKFGRGADVYPDQYSEDRLRRSVDASLKRLGVDALDLLQLHCIPDEVLRNGKVFDWLRRLKQEGLIKRFGASVETVAEGLFCLEQDELASLQVIFNIFRQKLVNALLPQAKTRGVGLIVRLPLASGLLTGKFTEDTQFAETDHRHFNRNGECFNVGETFAGLPFEKGVQLADKLQAFLPDGMSMAQMALRWILDHDAVSTIIPGASSPEQAKANAMISGMQPLPDDLHQALSEFYTNNVHQHIRGPY